MAYFQENRAMITLLYIRIDFCVNEVFFQVIRYIDIINPPPFVLQTHTWKPLAPPAVTARFWMELTETVNPARAE